MILITGAGGLLGANLTFDLNSRGLAVAATGRAWLPAIQGVPTFFCDLDQPAQAQSLIREYRPDCVIHCAALTDVDRCEADPALASRVNAEAAGALAMSASAAGAQFVYISTDSVFDGVTGGYSEESNTRPVNGYARSKLQGENAVRSASPDALIVRTNIYGWNMQPKTSLAEWMLGKLETASEFPAFHDVVFCPILVNDLGDTIIDMVEQKLTGVYNVSGGEACSKYEFGLQLADTFGLDRTLVRSSSIDDSALRAPRPRNTSLDTSRIRTALRRPMPSVKAGLERFRELRSSGFTAKLKESGKRKNA